MPNSGRRSRSSTCHTRVERVVELASLVRPLGDEVLIEPGLQVGDGRPACSRAARQLRRRVHPTRRQRDEGRAHVGEPDRERWHVRFRAPSEQTFDRTLPPHRRRARPTPPHPPGDRRPPSATCTSASRSAVVDPSVSTAESRFTSAPRRAMARTPTANATVIVSSSPSGTFAASRPTAKTTVAAQPGPAARGRLGAGSDSTPRPPGPPDVPGRTRTARSTPPRRAWPSSAADVRTTRRVWRRPAAIAPAEEWTARPAPVAIGVRPGHVVRSDRSAAADARPPARRTRPARFPGPAAAARHGFAWVRIRGSGGAIPQRARHHGHRRPPRLGRPRLQIHRPEPQPGWTLRPDVRGRPAPRARRRRVCPRDPHGSPAAAPPPTAAGIHPDEGLVAGHWISVDITSTCGWMQG